MYKHPVVKGDSFEFSLQEVDGRVFVHLDVWRYNKSVLLEMAEAFEDLKDSCAMEGIKELYAFSANHKFCRMGGGELVQIKDWKGEDYGVYRWEVMF